VILQNQPRSSIQKPDLEFPDLEVANSQVEPQIGARVGVRVVLELGMFETPYYMVSLPSIVGL
jgi:hypothetical protein